MKKKLTTMILVLGAAIGLAAAQSIATHEKVQLWEGGPYWATTNIGAEKPEDYGYYFWWGDTVGYRRQGNAWVATDGSSSNFRFWDSSKSMQTYNKSISTLQSDGWVVLKDGAYVLAPKHDAAQVQWGGGWRMPTDQEMDDLCHNKCDWTWTTQNGVNGYIVRGRGDYAAANIFPDMSSLLLARTRAYQRASGSAFPVAGFISRTQPTMRWSLRRRSSSAAKSSFTSNPLTTTLSSTA